LYWAGHLVSLSGTWMQAAAQGWLVLRITDSPLYLGIVSAAGSLPLLFFTLFGGVLADRFQKRSLLLLTQGLSVLPAAVLGALTWLGVVDIWQILTLVTLLGIVNSLDIPVRQSFIIDLVEPASLPHAIALNAAAFNAARMIGPAIAGFIIGWVGLHVCFFLNSLSFGASLLALYLVRPRGNGNAGTDETGVFERMKEGFAYLRQDRGVLALMILVSVFSLFGLPYATLLPVFARDILHVDSQGYGLMMSCVGFGALLGAVWLAFRVSGTTNRVIRLAGLIFGGGMVAFSRSPILPLSMLLLFFTGISAVVVISSINVGIQKNVPDHLRGRVMSIYTTLFLGMFPIGSLIMGGLSQAFGVQVAVGLGGILCMVSVAVMPGLGGASHAGARLEGAGSPPAV